jgi:hypothetical protein
MSRRNSPTRVICRARESLEGAKIGPHLEFEYLDEKLAGRGMDGKEMSTLAYRCPNTSNDVLTSIDIDRRALEKLRNLKVSVACPHCIGGHSIPANEMHFGQGPMVRASQLGASVGAGGNAGAR